MQHLLFVALAVVAPCFLNLLAPPIQAQTFRDATHLLDRQPDRRDGLIFGASAVDVNADGRSDIFHKGRFYVQQPDGSFLDRLEESGLFTGRSVFGGVFADYDGDGHLDVFVENFEPAGYLQRNQGNATFVDVGDEAGVVPEIPVQGSIWADFNEDGALDLFVGSDDGVNLLYTNSGNGGFVESALERVEQSYGVVASDLDNDGDLDIFIAGCSQVIEASYNVLFENQGDMMFSEVSSQAGVRDSLASWAALALDYDNDGWQDLYVVNMPMAVNPRRGFNMLYRNNADGTFSEVSAAAGAAGSETDFQLGASAADFDNDGWIDIVITGDRNRLLRNRGDGTFHDVTSSAGIPESSTAVAVADFDDDGWIDLFLGAQDGSHLLLNEGGSNHRLIVRTRTHSANRYGIGARIDVYAGGRAFMREIAAGDGMTSQNHDLSAHFGLGTASSIDSIVVRWPGGHIDRLFDVSVDASLTIVEGLGANAPPSTLALRSPEDGAVVDMTTNTVTFEWSGGSDDDGDVVTYDLTITGPSLKRAFEGLTERRHVVDAAELGGEGIYRWSVSANDTHSLRGSLTRSFTYGSSTSIDQNGRPLVIQALEAFPSPFAASTIIRYSVAIPSSIEIAVFDLTGRRIRMLENGFHMAGSYSVLWNGRNDQGADQPSGVYVIRAGTLSAAVVRVR